MTFSRFISRSLTSLIIAALVAVPFSGDDLISLRVWITISTVIMASHLLLDAFTTAHMEPASIATAWTWRRGKRARSASHPSRELRSIKGTLASAQFNPRSFGNRLRPRLVEVTKHFLPIQQGIDPMEDSELTAELLGDLAWLIDPEVVDRAPTLSELDQFLDIVLGERHESEIT